MIASVTQPFCHDCSRARLSAEGRLYTCLFAATGHDLRGRLRSGAGDEELEAFLRRLWGRRADRYSELRTAETIAAGPRSRCRTSAAESPRKSPIATGGFATMRSFMDAAPATRRSR